MNIFFVSQRYHPFVGGVETQTRMVVADLSKRHHVEVGAVSFADTAMSDRMRVLEDSLLARSHESFEDGSVHVHSLTPTWRDRVRLLPILVRAMPRLQRYYYHSFKLFGYQFYRAVYVSRLRILMKGFDVVHSVAGNYLGWAAQEAAADLGIPFICNPYVHPGQHGDDAASIRHYNRSDVVFALLETDRRILLELGVSPSKVQVAGVVPLLPAETDAVAFRSKHGLMDAPVVLFVGRMMDYKGVSTILEAAPAVWEASPDVQFVFVGPANESRVQEMAKTDHRVHYLGRVDEQEKADALAACDIFCMPSVHEILPAVYLEAWTYGRPVIGGTAPGLAELIEGNGAGIVVEQEPSILADAILGLLCDPKRRHEFGERGRDLVRRRYSKQALVETYEKAYAAVARKGPGDLPYAPIGCEHQLSNSI